MRRILRTVLAGLPTRNTTPTRPVLLLCVRQRRNPWACHRWQTPFARRATAVLTQRRHPFPTWPFILPVGQPAGTNCATAPRRNSYKASKRTLPTITGNSPRKASRNCWRNCPNPKPSTRCHRHRTTTNNNRRRMPGQNSKGYSVTANLRSNQP